MSKLVYNILKVIKLYLVIFVIKKKLNYLKFQNVFNV